MKKAGIWVVGADASSEAHRPARGRPQSRPGAGASAPRGADSRTLVKRECDYLVRIPMRGRVASLNASVAAAILIYEALRQRECSLRP